MGLFNSFLDQTQELTAKQIQLEYGPILLKDENIERALKADKNKLIFTGLRLLAVIRGKGYSSEILSIPYTSISRFSICGRSLTASKAELNIYLNNEEKPLKTVIKNPELLQDVYKILSKSVSGHRSEHGETPVIEMNRSILKEQIT